MTTKPQTNTVDFFIGLPKEFKPVSSSNNSDDNSGIKTAIFLLKSNEWSFDNDADCFKKKTIMDILNDYNAP